MLFNFFSIFRCIQIEGRPNEKSKEKFFTLKGMNKENIIIDNDYTEEEAQEEGEEIMTMIQTHKSYFLTFFLLQS